jgi:hypothetical protein
VVKIANLGHWTGDDFDDPVGCIFTKNLIVEDVTAAEIIAAAGEASGAASAVGSGAGMGADTASGMGAGMGGSAAADTGTGMATGMAAGAGAGAGAGADTGAATGATAGAGMGASATGSDAGIVQGDLQPAVLIASEGDQSSCADSGKNTLGEAQNEAAAPAGVAAGGAAAGGAAAGGAAAPPAGLDFGSCPNAGIVFGPGFDGRKESSFQPADKTQFTQGSALSKLSSHLISLAVGLHQFVLVT